MQLNLFDYALKAIKYINAEAERKLSNPKSHLMEYDVKSAASLLDKGERVNIGNINTLSRTEKAKAKESFGIWEYHYSPQNCQKTVDWMLENDPSYFMLHIAGCRNRGRGTVYRMDNLQDYANTKLFGGKH